MAQLNSFLKVSKLRLIPHSRLSLHDIPIAFNPLVTEVIEDYWMKFKKGKKKKKKKKTLGGVVVSHGHFPSTVQARTNILCLDLGTPLNVFTAFVWSNKYRLS